MNKFLIATHGYFAEGIYNSLKIIMGDQNNVATLCAYVDGKSDLKNQVSSIINALSEEDNLIVLTDLFGGSVNNEFMNYINGNNIHLIAGVSLPLLIELISRQEEEEIEKLIGEALANTKDSIQYCNYLIKKQEKIEDEDF